MLRQVTFLARVLAAAAVAEFVLLRLLLRMGPMLPEGGPVTAVLGWATTLGEWSLNVAAVASLLLLATLSLALARAEEVVVPWTLRLAAPLALAVGLAGLVLPRAAPGTSTPLLLLALSATSLVVLAMVVPGLASRRRARLPLAVAVSAIALGLYHYLARSSEALGTPLPGIGLSLALAESLALLVAPAVLAALRPGWKLEAAAAATAVAALYAGAALAQPWMTAALAIWDLSFTSFLPAYVYTAALWLLVYTVVALLGHGKGHLVGLGLAVLALGGLRLDYAYFTLLALTGTLLLATALHDAAPARLRRDRQAAQPAHLPTPS